MRKVEVVPYDPKWRELFAVESNRVMAALGANAIAIHHIGSTAIPGIFAKPIIDLLAEVANITKADARNAALASLGYEAMGEFGIPGRRYFRKGDRAGNRTHHVHIFTLGSNQVKRHLAFRDYLIAHPEDARRYSELKRRLASQYPTDIDSYMDGKNGFIEEIDRKAARW